MPTSARLPPGAAHLADRTRRGGLHIRPEPGGFPASPANNAIRHGRAMRAPTAGCVRRGCIRRVGAARADMKSAPTGLLSGYSLGQGLSLADGFGGQFASAKRLALHTKRPAYAGSAGGVRSTPYSLLLYSTAIWARYSYSMVAGGLLVMS